jgi:hypothetical protein
MTMDGLSHYQQLATKVKILKDRVRSVALGLSNGLYIHGRPGVAKTHLVCTTLQALGVPYAYSSGHLTPIGLFSLLDENSDSIIVLDDLSALFYQPTAIGLLLAALGNRPDGSRVRPVRYKTAREDSTIAFRGAIIGISNLRLEDHRRHMLQAFHDRVYVLHFEPSDEQIVAQIFELASKGVRGISPDDCHMVATHLVEQCRLREIRPSIRLFVDKALKDYELFDAGIPRRIGGTWSCPTSKKGWSSCSIRPGI